MSLEMYKGVLADPAIRGAVLPSVLATACIGAARAKLGLFPAVTREMEVASNGHIYVLAATTDPVKIIKSTDEFATEPTVITLPNDADTGISSNDFTRGQSFYDLVIDSDPNNPDHIFVGGIDLFKSTTGAVSSDGSNPWTQISHWYGGSFGGKSYQYVHADQHGMVFAPNDSSKKLFLNDPSVINFALTIFFIFSFSISLKQKK